MTYPEPDPTPRFGEGFRVEPEFRQASGSPEGPLEATEAISYSPGIATTALSGAGTGSGRAVTAAELDGAFDDPEKGEPGRDRFGVHFIWEAVLLVACAGMAYALIATHTSPFSGDNLKFLLRSAAVLGALALAASVSMRTAAINLAIGPIAVLAGLFFAHHRADGFSSAAGLAIAVAAGCGAVIALVTTVAHVPAWAVSLAGGFGAILWALHLPSSVTINPPDNTSGQAYYWFAAFAVLSIGGALIGAIRPLRRQIGSYRSVSDPADRRPVGATVVAGLALLVSSVIAGIAGVAGAALAGGAGISDGALDTGTGIAIALLGGVSAFGRRGGIFGTVLATVLCAMTAQWTAIHHWRNADVTLVAIALGVGLLVTRLIETYGRPLHAAAAVDGAAPFSWLDRQHGVATNASDLAAVEPTDPRWGAR